jgi:hypothetical protein
LLRHILDRQSWGIMLESGIEWLVVRYVGLLTIVARKLNVTGRSPEMPNAFMSENRLFASYVP